VVQEIFVTVHDRIAWSHRRAKKLTLFASDTPQLELEGMGPADTSPYRCAMRSENAELHERLLQGLDSLRRKT
jgi:hypothetical protein